MFWPNACWKKNLHTTLNKTKKERIREQKEKTKKETAMIHRLRWNLWKEFDPVDAEDGRSDALFHFLPLFFFFPFLRDLLMILFTLHQNMSTFLKSASVHVNFYEVYISTCQLLISLHY